MEQNTYNRRVVKLTIVIIFLSFLVPFLSWEKIPPLVPLFYSLPWGKEQLAEPIFLFIFPISSAFILAMNTVITKLSGADGFLNSIAVFSAMIFSFLSLFALIRIISLVI